MADYPYSIFGYFFVGTIGSLVFLYLLLLYEKNLRILDNEFTSPFIAGVLYVICGGVLTVVVNIANSINLNPSQLPLAFATGFSWPAVASGIGSIKRVSDLSQDNQHRRLQGQELDYRISAAKKEVGAYWKKRHEQSLKMFEMALKNAENERKDIKQYYSQNRSL